MRELLPGVWHWTAPRTTIGDKPVSSYWLDSGGVLIDPLVPPDVGLDWFAARPTPPSAIVLSNRHHYRDSDRFHERFGCGVRAPAAAMHAFTAAQAVTAYQPDELLPGGLRAIEVGVLSPDDGGLFLESSRALWLADTLVRNMTDPDSRIGFVIDQLMDDPEQTKAGLLERFQALLDSYEFDHLMLAHGLPLIGNGRAELEQFVADGGRTATDAF